MKKMFLADCFLVGIILLATKAVAVAPYHEPHCPGRAVVVHLFEWKWTDIAAECERYLGPKGFCGVQTSPANEHTVITSGAMRPWWERYQPVSYKLQSRSGTEAEFKDMVGRCRKVGVRIFVDVVINHMAGLGRIGVGTAGSHFDSSAYDFPGVPFSKPDFHDPKLCPSHDGNVNNYGDPNNVRNCNLVGLTDLDGSNVHVQDEIAGFLNHMVDLGVAGFRVDAAKHMWPQDLAAIQAKTKDLPEGGRPFFFLEVIDRNDGAIKVDEYFGSGYVTEFRYSQKVAEGASDLGRLGSVYDPGWGMAPPDQALVFVDNHDTQRGNQALTYKNGEEYKRAVAFTIAYNYGFPRVMSSYAFTDTEMGPPHNADYSIADVPINADGSCGGGWVCEHRWPMIGNLVQFRAAVQGTDVRNWSYKDGVLSFARGDKGFFAMSKNGFSQTVQTGLPAGEYCDLISECATKIRVDGSGAVTVSPADPSVPYVAFVVGGASAPTATAGTPPPGLGSTAAGVSLVSVVSHHVTTDAAATTAPQRASYPTQPPTLPSDNPNADYQRTIILVEKQTSVGQDVFVRGGLDHAHFAACTNDISTSACAIPIQHLRDGDTHHYDPVNSWMQGDNYLDWFGAEAGQGTYQGRPAAGTPAFWSTDDPTHDGYQPVNTYGPHYWVVDVMMDCSRTLRGQFEVKAVVSGQWENDVNSAASCSGAPDVPYQSTNHWAVCGKLNVFHFGARACEVTDICHMC